MLVYHRNLSPTYIAVRPSKPKARTNPNQRQPAIMARPILQSAGLVSLAIDPSAPIRYAAISQCEITPPRTRMLHLVSTLDPQRSTARLYSLAEPLLLLSVRSTGLELLGKSIPHNRGRVAAETSNGPLVLAMRCCTGCETVVLGLLFTSLSLTGIAFPTQRHRTSCAYVSSPTPPFRTC